MDPNPYVILPTNFSVDNINN